MAAHLPLRSIDPASAETLASLSILVADQHRMYHLMTALDTVGVINSEETPGFQGP
jgi:hypothetical protein